MDVVTYVDSVGRSDEQIRRFGQHGQRTIVAGIGAWLQRSFKTYEGMCKLLNLIF